VNVYHCQKCGSDNEYDPNYLTAEQMAKFHLCPDEKAQRPKLRNPYAGMTWSEECIARQREAPRVRKESTTMRRMAR
jgi:hypothetical protein